MRLLSSYKKEMIIAARGFYFYIEVFFAVIILLILMVGVKEEGISKQREFLFYEMPQAVKDAIIQKEVSEGRIEIAPPTEFKMKPLEFKVTNSSTGLETEYIFNEDLLKLNTYKYYDLNSGKLDKTVYVTESEEDLIRISFQEKSLGASIIMDNTGELSYRYYLEGYETKKFVDLIKILHNESRESLEKAFNSQNVKKLSTVKLLNRRENLIPVVVVFMGSLMGFFIVMAYIFLDKSEGVIKAFVVTPATVGEYLFTKTLVIISTVIMSSSIITIPVMGLRPNYLLFYILLIISTFAFASLGLFVASFFDTISKAFGILYFLMVAMMVPAFSYFVPGFDPVWLRFFPTYPMIQSMREIVMGGDDIQYIGYSAVIFLIFGFILFGLSNYRFKKSLTV